MFTVAESEISDKEISAAHRNKSITKSTKYRKKTHIQQNTSIEEDAEDAWALKAEEGRGDRRNVQGELQASDEP